MCIYSVNMRVLAFLYNMAKIRELSYFGCAKRLKRVLLCCYTVLLSNNYALNLLLVDNGRRGINRNIDNIQHKMLLSGNMAAI